MEEKNQKEGKKITEEQAVSFEMLKIFYTRPTPLVDDTGKPFPVPHDGSLGLLALGHIGLIEWRKSRDNYIKEKARKEAEAKLKQ